jgi:hypothetical protein
MNKTQLVERVCELTLLKYGQNFTESLFDDLNENGLIPKGIRLGNDGKHPIYDFGYASYRRALQIARFQSRGIIRRDAIRVGLFLAGYSEPVFDVREALCREYVAHGKSILHQIRSGYADNWKRVPPNHKQSFMRQAGPLDTRFEAAGLGISSDQVIELLRTAKQNPVYTLSNNDKSKLREQLFARLSFQDFSEALLQTFSGLLMFNPERDAGTTDVGEIENLITSTDDDSFACARRLYRVLVRSGFANLWEYVETAGSPEARKIASGAAVLAILEQPEFAASVLVQCLRSIREFPTLKIDLSGEEDCDRLLNLLSALTQAGVGHASEKNALGKMA